MPSLLSVTYLDYSGERSTVNLNIPLVTAANFAATATLINTLLLAAPNIIGGVINRRILTIPSTPSGLVPADEEAQREDKWLVGYTDTTANLAAGVSNPYFGKRFTVEIATAELTGHLQLNSDFADLAEADVVAFVNAFEAMVRSPAGGVAEVNYIKFVGRNQ